MPIYQIHQKFLNKKKNQVNKMQIKRKNSGIKPVRVVLDLVTS